MKRFQVNWGLLVWITAVVALLGVGSCIPMLRENARHHWGTTAFYDWLMCSTLGISLFVVSVGLPIIFVLNPSLGRTSQPYRPLLQATGLAVGTFVHSVGCGNFRNGNATVWDLRTHEPMPDAPIWAVVFRVSDRWACPRIGQEGKIEIIDIESGQLLQTLGVHAGLKDMAVTLDSRNIATLSHDGTLIIWDVELAAPLLTVESSGAIRDSQSLGTRASFDVSAARLAFVDDSCALALFQRGGHVRYWRLRPPAAP